MRMLAYTTAALLTLSSVLYGADPKEARKLADYAVKNGSHEAYSASGHKIDSYSARSAVREDEKDALSRLEIDLSRLLVDGREVLTLTGNIFNPLTGRYIRIQLDDGGLEKPLPLDGKVDTVEMAVSEDGKRFTQVAVPDEVKANSQNIFDIYVGKLLRKIG